MTDLGNNHSFTFVEFRDDSRIGISYYHTTPEGNTCNGFITFEGGAWANAFDNKIPSWKVISFEPLTITPSLLCKACGDHGFITDGKWVPA